MATIHIREIQRLLAERGETDARPTGGGMFVEIRFDEPGPFGDVVDEDFAKKVLTADAPQGTVTITFDDVGMLRSLDIC